MHDVYMYTCSIQIYKYGGVNGNKSFCYNFFKIKINFHMMYFDMASCEENTICDSMT